MISLSRHSAIIRTSFLVIAAVSALPAGNEKNYTYLALGDSVAYGLDVGLLPPPGATMLPAPADFTGYPELLARPERLDRSKKYVNASCPGETSASFLRAGTPDYGCNSPGPQGQPPFRQWIGLHTDYAGTQAEFAISQLKANTHIDLVTLTLGANDVLMLLKSCAGDPGCVTAGLPPVLQQLGENLSAAAAAIRAEYRGMLVFTTYPAPTPDFIPVANLLNGVIRQVAGAWGARIADGYQAFYDASAAYGHDSCAAGLVGKIGGVCDVHPTLAGQQLLAAAVENAVASKK